jgi:spermidine/putrescine transport system ATP-binding protein
LAAWQKTTAGDVMLQVEKIYKSYNNQPLLRGISFSVAAGETVCLLGPSGSGKSTLLRLIAGLEEMEAGHILWDGMDMAPVPVHQRNFGLMFQDYALFPHYDVFENIAFGLRMQKLPKAEVDLRVRQALELVDLTAFAKRSIAELSGGEQQRVAYARAIAPRPRLLMLDEPLGALDKTLKEQLILDLHRLLHQTQNPAIYVTHDQEEAFGIGDRILLLHNGQVEQQGSPEVVYRNPVSVWAAKFLGLGNVIKGKVQSFSPLRVITNDGSFELPSQRIKANIGHAVSLVIFPDAATVTQRVREQNCITGKVVDCSFRGDGYKTRVQTQSKAMYEFILLKAISQEVDIVLEIDPQKIRYVK